MFQSLFAQNVLCTLGCFALVAVWLRFTEFIAEINLVSSSTARKLVHIFTGPLYIICWNVFPVNSPASPYFAATVPLAIVVKFTLIGLGIIRDEKAVKSISRSGSPRELLYGPVSYGVIFVISSIVYWGHSPHGITALMLLCVGDGFAGLLGELYGGDQRIPWNKKKSVLGSVCFFVLSLVASSIFIAWFHSLGWFSTTLGQFFPVLFVTTLISALVESLPSLEDWDNIVVFIVALTTMHTLY